MLNTMYIGFEKESTGKAIPTETSTQVLIKIKHAAAEQFGGYSAQTVDGGWINGNGELVEEKALRLEIVTDDEEGVHKLAEHAKLWLNQESVLLVTKQCQHSF